MHITTYNPNWLVDCKPMHSILSSLVTAQCKAAKPGTLVTRTAGRMKIGNVYICGRSSASKNAPTHHTLDSGSDANNGALPLLQRSPGRTTKNDHRKIMFGRSSKGILRKKEIWGENGDSATDGLLKTKPWARAPPFSPLMDSRWLHPYQPALTITRSYLDFAAVFLKSCLFKSIKNYIPKSQVP